MTFGTLGWLFVAAVALHNLEEAIWLPAWSRQASRFHRRVGAAEFRFAVTVLTALAVVVAIMAEVQGPGSAGAYLLSGYALAMLLNVAFPHLAATLVLRRYMPGLATAFVAILPATAFLLRRALGEGYVDGGRFLIVGPAVTVAILLSIPALFWIGRWVRRAWRAAAKSAK